MWTPGPFLSKGAIFLWWEKNRAASGSRRGLSAPDLGTSEAQLIASRGSGEQETSAKVFVSVSPPKQNKCIFPFGVPCVIGPPQKRNEYMCVFF